MPCKIEDCNQSIYVQKYRLCKTHYSRMKDHGDLNYAPWTGEHGLRKKSEVILHDTYAELILSGGQKATIDLDRVEEVSQYPWTLNSETGYVTSTRAGTSLHQFIKGKAPDDLTIDHENRDRLDCRENNLIFKSRRDNNLNKKFPYDVGVIRRGSKHKDRYYAYITSNGSGQISLGLFSSKDAAIEARKAAELQHFGFILDRHKGPI